MSPFQANLLALLTRLAEAGSGMPALRDLAEMMGAGHGGNIHTALYRLAEAGHLEAVRSGSAHRRSSWRLTAAGRVLDGDRPVRWPDDAAAMDTRAVSRERRCLCCGGGFLSSWAGNRICAPCKSLSAFGLEAESYRVAPPTNRVRTPLSRGRFG